MLRSGSSPIRRYPRHPERAMAPPTRMALPRKGRSVESKTAKEASSCCSSRVALGSLLTGLSVSDQKGNSEGRDISNSKTRLSTP